VNVSPQLAVGMGETQQKVLTVDQAAAAVLLIRAQQGVMTVVWERQGKVITGVMHETQELRHLAPVVAVAVLVVMVVAQVPHRLQVTVARGSRVLYQVQRLQGQVVVAV
jgi:hypothetical protein